MEPEQNRQPLPQPQVPVETPVASAPPVVPQPGSKHLLPILIIAIILAALAIGGIFFFINNKTSENIQPAIIPIVESPTPSPTITPANQEEADLQQIDVESGLEADLEDIEKDVQGL